MDPFIAIMQCLVSICHSLSFHSSSRIILKATEQAMKRDLFPQWVQQEGEQRESQEVTACKGTVQRIHAKVGRKEESGWKYLCSPPLDTLVGARPGVHSAAP